MLGRRCRGLPGWGTWPGLSFPELLGGRFATWNNQFPTLTNREGPVCPAVKGTPRLRDFGSCPSVGEPSRGLPNLCPAVPLSLLWECYFPGVCFLQRGRRHKYRTMNYKRSKSVFFKRVPLNKFLLILLFANWVDQKLCLVFFPL